MPSAPELGLLVLVAWAAACDLRTMTIPNLCSVGGTAAIIGYAIAAGDAPGPRMLAALTLAAPLALASAARPGSMGAGDAKLAALVGAGLGWLGLPALLAGLGGALAWSVACAIARPGSGLRGRVVPLAPFVAGGAALVLGVVG